MSAQMCAGTPLTAPAVRAWNVPAPATVTKTLANGLRVVLAEDHTVPAVFLSWNSSAGFELDPPGLEGIASLTPVLLREGTARRSGGQITEALDDLGAVLSAGADRDSTCLNLALLSSDLAAGAELLLDIACAATFPPAAVARLRRLRLAEIEQRREDPRAIANDELTRALYGETAHGRAPLGTAATVQRIDAAAVAAFHQDHYGPATSCVGVAGSFDVETASDLLGSFELPPLRAVPRAVQPCVAAAEPAGGVRLVDAPHAPQTEIRIGHAGVARDCEHLPGLEVLNAVLGGGPNSRLARRLRQRLGLAYHVSSRFAARRLAGTFVVETSVATGAAAAACAAIRLEIESLRDQLVPAADVERAKRRLLGADLRSVQDLIGTGLRLGPAVLRNESEYLERRAHAIATVEPDGLREMARRYLRPESLIAVLVGPVAALRSQFSSDEVAHTCQTVPLESIS